MSHRVFALLCLVLACTLGCGPTGNRGPAPDLSMMSKSVSDAVNDFVAQAKKSPAQAPQKLAILMESLEADARDFGAGFVTVRDAAQELKSLYERKAPTAEIDAQLDKLKAQADALSAPGS